MRTHGHRRRQLHRLRGRGGFFSTVTTVLLVAMALLLSPCLAEAYSLMPQDNGIREGQTVTINTIGSGYDSWYGEVNGTDWMAACVQLGPDSKPGSWTATARDLVGSPRHGGGTWNESQVRKCAIAQKYLLERLGQSDDAHKAFSAWVWHMSEQGGWDYHTEHVSSVRNLFASHSGGVSIAEVDNYVSEHYDDYRGYGWYFDPGNSLQAMAVFGLKPAPGYLTLNKYSDIEPTTRDNPCYSIEGAEYKLYSDSQCTKELATFTTGARGNTNTVELEPRDYWLKETKASKGYLLDLDVHKITVGTNANISQELSEIPASDSSWALVQKLDLVTGKPSAQGDASLEGAEFTVRYYANDRDDTSGNPTNSWVYRSDAHGRIAFDSKDALVSGSPYKDKNGRPTMPLGTYTIQETKAPQGYQLSDNSVHRARVYLDQKGQRAKWQNLDSWNTTGADASFGGRAVKDQVLTGSISGVKVDGERDQAVPQGDATLAGAQVSIVNSSEHSVSYGGKEFAKGSEVAVATTGEDGSWHVDSLPYASYTVSEKSPSKGYLRNEGWSQKVEVHPDGATGSFTSDKLPQTPIRGGIRVGKVDAESGRHRAIGATSLEGAEFTIYNRSAKSVLVAGDRGRVVQPGQVVMTITTGKDGIASTGKQDLPTGSYEVRETKAPNGYRLNDKWSRKVSIGQAREGMDAHTLRDGEFAELTSEGYLEKDGFTVPDPARSLSASDQAFRQDLSFHKKGEDNMETMPGVPFLLIAQSDADGDGRHEAHLMVTDANGNLDTSAFASGARDNSNDAALDRLEFTTDSTGRTLADLAKVHVDDADLDAGKGAWFSGRTDLTTSQADDLASLPYDSYVIQELPCKANAGKALVTFEATLTPANRKDGSTVDLGTVYDKTKPGISTTAFGPDKTSSVDACEDQKLTDLVTWRGLDPASKYRLTGELHYTDGTRDLGPVTDTEGKALTATKDFTVNAGSGTSEVTIALDASAMSEGTMLVCFERLTREDGSLVAEHADASDRGQTVTVRVGGHTKAQGTAGQMIQAASAQRVVDTIFYQGLVPGKTYTVQGTLHLRGDDGSDAGALKGADGSPLIASTDFTPQASSGEVQVTFDLDASQLAGRTVVAFEEVTQEKRTVFAHADITDDAQSIQIPKVSTTASSKEGGKEILAADDQTVKDEIAYQKLVPGKEYKVHATLHLLGQDGSDEGELEGSQAELTFSPESPDGTVSVEIPIDASKLQGRSVVAFEELSCEGVTVAAHADATDQGQTVHVPQIHTSATGTNTGTHEEAATMGAAITDTVAYQGLTPGRTYTVFGTLHVRDDEGKDLGVLLVDGSWKPADQLAEGDESVKAEAELVPQEADGTIGLPFAFDATQLQGKSVVAFEELVHDGVTVATHADISDENQTVRIPGIATTATVDGQKTVDAGKVTVTDTVEYHGLTPGKEYHAKGLVVDSKGEAISEESTTDFTPDQQNGKVDIRMDTDLSDMDGQKVVAFERLEDANGKVVAVHEDLSDEGQTIAVNPKQETPQAPEKPGTPESPRPSSPLAQVRSLAQTGLGLGAWLALVGGAALCVLAYRRSVSRGARIPQARYDLRKGTKPPMRSAKSRSGLEPPSRRRR